MDASTSKNQKLYGYLKGYERVCYTGQPLDIVTKSIRELIDDEMSILFTDVDLNHKDYKKIIALLERFLQRYYSRMKNVRGELAVTKLAEDSKESMRTIESIISSLMSGEATLECTGYLNSSPNMVPMDICEKCPWYLKDNHCLIFLYEEYDDPVIEVIKYKVSEYKYLEHAILLMAHYLVAKLGVSIDSLMKYYTIFTNMSTIGHIFELMNPSGEARQVYLDKALDMLKANPIAHDTPEYQEYDRLLTSVFEDIKEGKKNYIKDIRDALNASKHFVITDYDYEKDVYLSMKGTGQNRYTKERFSLQSSAFEVDIHLNDPRVVRFDEFIKFQSYYIRPEDCEDLPDYVIRTIGINNPGKYKTRIIHIADNPLQDRCNWIHRRLMAILKHMKTDCTVCQDNGRSFLRSLTGTWYFADPNQKIGVYCTDFSNATDTLDQRFSHRVLEFVFQSAEVADFWDYVSQLEKGFFNADGSVEVYSQKRGQPQGLLASFAAFALCHHFLFLMTMKENGLENCRAENFYRVLGDDSVYNTIYPEKIFLDPDEEFRDSEGNMRSYMELTHFNKCSIYAGFEINYDKSESAHHWSPEAKLDFAKVTYRNGKLFSPLPFRLAMRYSLSFDDKLATCIWRADRGDELKLRQLELVLDKLPEEDRPLYSDLIKCGELPYLKEFDDNIPRDSVWIQQVRYSSIITMLTSGLAFTLVKDNHIANSDYDEFIAAMNTIFTYSQQMRLDNISPHHKVMRLLEKNASILTTLHEIYQEDDLDDRFLSMCLASFMGDQEEDVLWMIYSIADFQKQLQLALANQNITYNQLMDYFPLIESKTLKSDVQSVSNLFMTRGITKRPGQAAFMFRQVINCLNSLQQSLLVIADRTSNTEVTSN